MKNHLGTPKVSIIMPVYNGANYMREAIDSALQQTYPNIEVVVVNDGSTDNGETEDVARQYGKHIRYIAKSNGGTGSALNEALRQMTGEYWSWLSHDDVYYSDKIEKQLGYLVDNQPIVLYADIDYINEKSEIIGSRKFLTTNPECFRTQLLRLSMIAGCTTLVPKACSDAVGLFDESLRYVQDYDMWIRLSRHFPIRHVPETVMKVRIHPLQDTNFKRSAVLKECNKIHTDLLNEITPDDIRLAGFSLPEYYADVALNMAFAGYDEAKQLALQKTKTFFLHQNFSAMRHTWKKLRQARRAK
jgi:glycosyltransferase involved in cell wall biosynthesis